VRGGKGGEVGGGGDMVEKIMHDFTAVVDGRKSWKELLGGLMEGGGLGILGGEGAGSGSGSGSRRKRRD